MSVLCECGCGMNAPIAKRTDRSRGMVKGQPMRFVQGHNGRLQRTVLPSHPIGMKGSEYRLEDLPARIAAKIRINPVSGCWEWQGTLRRGYGRTSWNGRAVEVHRLVYTIFVGAIPENLDIDHVQSRGCVSRACCWPAHLEAVTRRENNVRRAYVNQPACPRGHLCTPENTGRDKRGNRYCRACKREQAAERRAVHGDALRAYNRERKRAYRRRPA